MEARSMEHKTNFHEHLIWEILLKLPVKSLIRFMCVSKSWLSLLSDDNFAKLHFDLTASHTPKLLFDVSVVDSTSNKAQIRSIESERSLDVNSVNLVSPFPSPLESHDVVSILGVCRGFILLGHTPVSKKFQYPLCPKNLVVWNPLTGIHTTLSYSNKIGSVLARLSVSVNYYFYFDYDAFTDDYIVVIAWIQNNNVDMFELLSMRTNSWKQFDATHFPYTKSWRQPAFSFVNGAIHWLAIHKDDESVKAIIAFDFTERNCSKIPLPHDGFGWKDILRLEVIGGCLCLLCGRLPSRPGFAELWIMKEYNVKSSWTKCNYVPTHTTPFPGSIFCPIYFTKAGQIVGASRGIVAKLDDKGELLQMTVPKDCFTKCHIYTESLLSLPTTDFGQA